MKAHITWGDKPGDVIVIHGQAAMVNASDCMIVNPVAVSERMGDIPIERLMGVETPPKTVTYVLPTRSIVAIFACNPKVCNDPKHMPEATRPLPAPSPRHAAQDFVD